MIAAAPCALTVNVEQALHAAVAAFLQQAMDTHGVQITDVRADWLDSSGSGKPRLVLARLELQTITRPG